MSSAIRLMGVVNVTPDSFSDGGLFLAAEAAAARAKDLVREGADILDIGGESTRPGAEPVPVEEELRRVVPAIEAIAEADTTRAAQSGPQISIDTSKAAVAEAALAAGASFVNDVSALRADPKMAGVVASSGCECCLMHMLGEPRTMQADPKYRDVVDDVRAFLEARMAWAVRVGVAEDKIVLDPGIGFGKTLAHNLALLARLDEIAALGRPVLIGTSRKSFLGRVLTESDRLRGPAGAGESAEGSPVADRLTAGEQEGANQPEGVVPIGRRLAGTVATNVLAFERGASIFRVHDVAPVADALAVAAATLGGDGRRRRRRGR
ncbi:MAG TPA: dihydropteroate synthase [Solirubrobacteraceae bacterium]|nr:dihydropteroate synthase [Solirubrobacteraceae bacterium]